MKRILDGKWKLIDVFFLVLACYPLLKLNYATVLFVAFCSMAFIYAIKDRKFDFSKSRLKHFGILTLYFFLLIISIFYSENTGKGVNRMVQFIPLLLAPLVIFFFRPAFSRKIKTKALNIFLIGNIIYVLILFGFYVYYKDSVDLTPDHTGTFLSFDKIQFVLTGVINSYILFIHKAYFSMGFVLSAIFALSRANYYFRENNRWSLLYFSVFLFFSLLVVYTFSFPNVIALAFCIFFFILFESWKGTLKIRKFLLPSAIAMALIIFSVFYFSNDSDIKRGIGFVESVLYQKDVEGNDPRIEIYKTYDKILEKAETKDIIFGHGVGDEQLLIHRELEQRLIENKNKNLLSFNEEFNNGYWFRNNLDVIANAALSPMNIKNAEVLIEINDTDAVSHNISTDLILEKGVEYTFSVYARQGTTDRLIMRLGEIENRAYFNLKEGKVISYEGILDAAIEKAEGGWYRCSITVKGDGKALVILGLSNADETYIYKGANKELYVWGAQVERRNAVSSYVKNNKELMEYAYNENLNSHNNYLFFFISGGILCLAAFLVSLFILFRLGFKNKDILQWSFCTIIALNFLTENILSRNMGLMFVSVMAIILFSELKTKNNAEESI